MRVFWARSEGKETACQAAGSRYQPHSHIPGHIPGHIHVHMATVLVASSTVPRCVCVTSYPGHCRFVFMPYVYALLNLFDLTCAHTHTRSNIEIELKMRMSMSRSMRMRWMLDVGKEMDTTNIDNRQTAGGSQGSRFARVLWLRQRTKRTGGHATAPCLGFLYISRSHSHLIFKLLVVKISHVLLWQFIF